MRSSERIEFGQRGQAAQGFAQLQEAHVDIGRAGLLVMGPVQLHVVEHYRLVRKYCTVSAMTTSQLKLHSSMIGATILLFLLALAINELLFTRLEFAPGINWIYLPAGVRLLCTLLFAEAGAIGLLLVSWGVCFFYFFPNDPVRSFMGGILASASPYLVYLGMRSYARPAGRADQPHPGAAAAVRPRLFARQPPAPPSLVRPVRRQDRPGAQLRGDGDGRLLRHRHGAVCGKIPARAHGAGAPLKAQTKALDKAPACASLTIS